MPYNVPDSFFDQLEEDVMQEVKVETTQPKSRKKAHIINSAIAVAATLALFFVVCATLPQSEPVLASADDFASVEQAFGQLSTDDQDFLIQVYEEDDLFINP